MANLTLSDTAPLCSLQKEIVMKRISSLSCDKISKLIICILSKFKVVTIYYIYTPATVYIIRRVIISFMFHHMYKDISYIPIFYIFIITSFIYFY